MSRFNQLPTECLLSMPRGTGVQNKAISGVAGVAFQAKQKSGLRAWAQLRKKKMYWRGLIELGMEARLGSVRI